MIKTLRSQIGKIIGKSIVKYHSSKLKPLVDDLEYKERYQGRILDCMVGEIDDNYIETPETDNPVVKLEYSKEGVVKIPSLKGNTILVDADGNETDTPAEGCKLLSVGEQEDNKLIILSNNANRFDYTDVENIKKHHYYTSTGEFSGYQGEDGNDFCDLKFYNVKGLYGVTLINNNGELTPLKIVTYDKNKNFIRRIQQSSTRANVILESNEHYIRIGGGLSSISTLQLYNLSVTSLNYTPHKSYKTEILLDEPLVKGNYIDCNKYVAQYKKITFDGSEHWGSFETKDDTVKVFLGSNQEKLANVKSVQNALNNYNILYGYNGNDYEHFYLDANFALFLNKSRGINTLQEFKDYLSKNNFELIVELKEPIIEELPNGITLQGFDDTTMYIENSITPTVTYGYNALIPYKNELSNQKEEVEVNTLDIENNIIPYLLDMEFNLMTMEDK